MPTSTLVPDAAPGAPGTATPEARPLLRGWLHALAVLGVMAGGPLLLLRAPDTGAEVALSVYVLSMLALFGVSAAFHRVRWSPVARRRMRRADHSTIFVGIAGTYTAVAVLALSGWAEVCVLSIVWVGAACGIAVRQVWLDLPKWAVAIPYLVVGWCALAVLPQLWRGLGPGGFALVLAGGVAYSVGAAVYGARRPSLVPGVFGYHELFHACTVIGASLHYAALSAFALSRP